MCGLNWLKPERSVKSVEKAVVSFPRLCSDRCLRKALREYWGFFSLRRIVIPSKYSRWLPVNKQSTEKMDSREEKALFSTTSMMITVLKDSALRYFKHRNVHWTDGHTRIHSGKRFHFMSNTFHVEVSGHYILLFSVTQRAVGSPNSESCVSLLQS